MKEYEALGHMNKIAIEEVEGSKYFIRQHNISDAKLYCMTRIESKCHRFELLSAGSEPH